ncbi:Protein STU1 [Nakaseomyces bracarensis]|uniref:Protein STU1 n=1 Tax=Nakaseomyces bracarensis TaxID=273131 RepID=A0ABR4NYR5_9SACH
MDVRFEKFNDLNQDDKCKLLQTFKGHVKKELVDVKAVPLYFRVLLHNTTNDHRVDHNLEQVRHSALCYLIKRVAMQTPSYFQDPLVVRDTVGHLLLDMPGLVDNNRNTKRKYEDEDNDNGDFGGSINDYNNNNIRQQHENLGNDIYVSKRKFWMPAIKAVEAIYHVSEALVVSTMHNLLRSIVEVPEKDWPQKFNNVLLAMVEISSSNKKPSIIDSVVPTISSTLNAVKLNSESELTQEVKTTLDLVADMLIDYIPGDRPLEFIQTLKNSEMCKYLEDKLIHKNPQETISNHSTQEQEEEDMGRNLIANVSQDNDSVFQVNTEIESLLKESLPPNFNNYNISTPTTRASLIIYESLDHFQSDLDNLLSPFSGPKETEQNWKLRQANIIQLRKCLEYNKSEDSSVIQYEPEGVVALFKEILLIESISKGIVSLRTTLSFASCQLLKDIIIIFHAYLPSNMIDQIFNIFKNQLSSTKKITSQIASHCIIVLLANLTHFSNRLFQNSFVLINSKNLSSRYCSSLFLKILILRYHNSQKFDSNLIYMEEWLKKGLTDSQTVVRESMRITFWYFYKCYPINGKKILTSGLTPQLKKAIELAIPQHLDIQYQPSASIASGRTSNTSSRRSSLIGQKRFPSYAQPTQSSVLQKNINNNNGSPIANVRSTSAYSSRENESQLNGTSLNNRLNHVTRKSSAPIPIQRVQAERSGVEKRSGSPPITTTPSHKRDISIDLSEEISAKDSNILTKKYIENALQAHNENKIPVSIKSDANQLTDLYKMFDNIENTEDLTVIQIKEALQDFFLFIKSYDVQGIDIKRLIQPLRKIMIKSPYDLKPLLKMSWFASQFDLSYLIELYSINNLSIEELFHVLSSNSVQTLRSCISIIDNLETPRQAKELENNENETGTFTMLSLYYLKFRKFFYNYTFRIIKSVIENKFRKLQEQLPTGLISELIKLFYQIFGKEFDLQIYYETFYSFYKYNKQVFIDISRELPLFPTVFKVCNELNERNEGFNASDILVRERTSIEDGVKEENTEEVHIPKDDEYKQYMEMTMVNPFGKEGNQRTPSSGSVVHNPSISEEADVDSGLKMKRKIGEDDTIGLNLLADEPRLTEMTKIVFTGIPGNKKQKTESDGDTNTEKRISSVEIADIFNGKSEFSHENNVANEPTVKFSMDPPKVILKSKEQSKPPANQRSVVKKESPDTNDDINGINSGSQPIIEDNNSNSNIEEETISPFVKHLNDCPVTLLEILQLVMRCTYNKISNNPEEDFNRMQKSLERIKSRGFTMKHIDDIIRPLLSFESNTTLRNWLEDNGGYQELLDLVTTILQSLSNSDQFPAKLFMRSMVLTHCLIVLNTLIKEALTLKSSQFHSIWDQIITISGTLTDDTSALYGLFKEVRKQLITQDFFDSKAITRILNILMTEIQDEKSTMEIFLIDTLAEIIEQNPLWTSKTYRLMEIVQSVAYMVESKNAKVRNSCFRVLISIYKLQEGRSSSYKQEVKELYQCLPDKLVSLVEQYSQFL